MWPGDPTGIRGQEEQLSVLLWFMLITKISSTVLWTGELKCGPKAKDAHLWILIWEKKRGIHAEGILLEVGHVKADRS